MSVVVLQVHDRGGIFLVGVIIRESQHQFFNELILHTLNINTFALRCLDLDADDCRVVVCMRALSSSCCHCVGHL
jgi:hypothetical protein